MALEIPIEKRALLPEETLAQLARIDEWIEQATFQRWPVGEDEKAERRVVRHRRTASKHARRSVLDRLVEQMLTQRVTSPADAGKIYEELTRKGFSRRPRRGARYVTFQVDRRAWTLFSGRFERFSGRGHRGSNQPDLLAFCYLLEAFPEGDLQSIVEQGISQVPELQGVVSWTSVSPGSSSSSPY